MERRPPSGRVQNQASHGSDQRKDAKEAFTRNDATTARGEHHESHEAQSNEAFLKRMNEKLKESGKKDKKK